LTTDHDIGRLKNFLAFVAVCAYGSTMRGQRVKDDF
jgi:hypothetical protein